MMIRDYLYIKEREYREEYEDYSRLGLPTYAAFNLAKADGIKSLTAELQTGCPNALYLVWKGSNESETH